MNQVSHVPLEEMIAAARGEPLGPRAAGHLAGCEGCAVEVRSWKAVAGGIRVLVRGSQPDRVIGRVLAAIDDEPSRPGPVPSPVRAPLAGRAGRGLRRRGYGWLAAAAAAAVLLAGGGYGVSTLLGSAGGHGASTRAGAALTSTGCSTLKAAGGTLTSVKGAALVIRSADGGSVTVTTSAATTVVREVAGTLRDVTEGIPVTVFGTNVGGTIDAKSVAFRNGAASSLGRLPAGPPGHGRLSLRLGLASGTVADVTRTGFTVDQPGGSRVRVATSPATTVLTLVTSGLGQLRAGELTSAVGAPGPDGSLAATMVEQDTLTTTPVRPVPPPGLPGGLPKPGHQLGPALPALPAPPARLSPGSPGSLFSGLGCSQDAIATTYLMSLAR